jgi:hypothetical protein
LGQLAQDIAAHKNWTVSKLTQLTRFISQIDDPCAKKVTFGKLNHFQLNSLRCIALFPDVVSRLHGGHVPSGKREAYNVAKNIVRPIAGAVVGMALCFSSTIAAAASVPAERAPFAPASISPFVALSAFGTMQSREAVCAAAVGAAGVAAAAEGQAPAQGCVLPVLDPVAPVAVQTAPAVAVEPASGFGLGVGALLAGLALVAGLAAVLLKDDNGDLPIGNGGLFPISPS